jgi:AraC-like DNA-binding protein
MSVDWIHFIPDSVYLDHLLKTCSLVIPLDIELFSSFTPLFRKLNDFFATPCQVKNGRAITLEIQAFVQFAIAQVLMQINTADFETSVNFIRLLPALELINIHYKSNICLKMLADECCLSPNYFHRIFRKNFGSTPFDYILKMRMEEALRLLIYTEKSIKEIAYNLGYEDEAYFSRMFSKNYDESPGRYRKNNQNRMP